MNLKIIVRTKFGENTLEDIKGKMAAQVAHAYVAGFLSLFDRYDDRLVLNNENMDVFKLYTNNKEKIDFVFIENKKDMELFCDKHENVIKITDQGLTVFNEPTLTTAIIMPQKGVYNRFNSDCFSSVEEDNAQVLIMDKAYSEDTIAFFDNVAKTSMMTIIKAISNENEKVVISLKDDVALKNWIMGKFKKVVLKNKTSFERNNEFIDQSYNKIAYYENDNKRIGLAVGIDSKEVLAEVYKRNKFSLY